MSFHNCIIEKTIYYWVFWGSFYFLIQQGLSERDSPEGTFNHSITAWRWNSVEWDLFFFFTGQTAMWLGCCWFFFFTLLLFPIWLSDPKCLYLCFVTKKFWMFKCNNGLPWRPCTHILVALCHWIKPLLSFYWAWHLNKKNSVFAMFLVIFCFSVNWTVSVNCVVSGDETIFFFFFLVSFFW